MGLAGLALWGLIHPRADIILIRFNAASLALLLATAGVVLSHRALAGSRDATGIQFHSNRVDSGNERGAGVEDTLEPTCTKWLSSSALFPPWKASVL